MTAFAEGLAAVQEEIFEAGVDDTAPLIELLDDLGQSDLPSGVTRLPTAGFWPGPHLLPQHDRSRVRAIPLIRPDALSPSLDPDAVEA